MEKKRILLVGESWVTSANHTKGWDTFSSVTFHLGAEPLGARHTMARPAWGERGEGQGASGCAGHCAPPGRSRWPSPACGWKPWKWPYPGMDVRYRAALAAKRLRRMAGLQAALDSGARLARPIVVLMLHVLGNACRDITFRVEILPRPDSQCVHHIWRTGRQRPESGNRRRPR